MPRTKATPAPVTPDAPDVRLVPIDSLHLDPHNVRTHPEKNLTAIRDSLRAFGQQKPLVVTPDGLILAGNGTWSAAKTLGWPQIAVQVSTLSPDQARAYAVADNRTGELALWDETALADMLRDLHAQALPLPGWDEAELQKLCAGTTPLVEVEPEIDRAAELREQYGVQSGQLWACGEHRVLCGDCTDKAVVERVMQGTMPAVVSDPPYGIHMDTSWLSRLNVSHRKRPNKSDAPLIGDDGSLDLAWLFAFPEWLLFGFPHLARHEPYTGLLVWDKRGDGGEDGLGNPVEVAASNAFNGYRLKRYVWAGYVRAAGEKRYAHPTQKPVGIVADAIALVHAQDIFDPFLGSGTTLIAAHQLNRRCYGIEIDPAYVATSLERWSRLTGETPVLVED